MKTSGVVDGFLYSSATLLTRSTSVPLKPCKLSLAFGNAVSNSDLTLFHQMTEVSSESNTYVVEYATVSDPVRSSVAVGVVVLPQAITSTTGSNANSADTVPTRLNGFLMQYLPESNLPWTLVAPPVPLNAAGGPGCL